MSIRHFGLGARDFVIGCVLIYLLAWFFKSATDLFENAGDKCFEGYDVVTHLCLDLWARNPWPKCSAWTPPLVFCWAREDELEFIQLRRR